MGTIHREQRRLGFRGNAFFALTHAHVLVVSQFFTNPLCDQNTSADVCVLISVLCLICRQKKTDGNSNIGLTCVDLQDLDGLPGCAGVTCNLHQTKLGQVPSHGLVSACVDRYMP